MIRVSKSLYSREVLLKTAYSFTDRAYLHLEQDEKDWIISWKPREGQVIDAGEFENELIAQNLREELLEQTMDLRKVILARAFASTVMDNQPAEDAPGQAVNAPAVPEELTPVTEKEKEAILRGWFDG